MYVYKCNSPDKKEKNKHAMLFHQQIDTERGERYHWTGNSFYFPKKNATF